MSNYPISSNPGRVVAVSRDHEFLQKIKALASSLGIDISCHGRPRAAVSDFLTTRASTLVIDLRIMGPQCLKMLDLAKRENLVMLALGPLPLGMTADQLSGLALVGFGDLSQVLVDPSETANSTKPVDEINFIPVEPANSNPVAPDQNKTPIKIDPQHVTKQQDDQMSDLLSPEELSALLEDN